MTVYFIAAMAFFAVAGVVFLAYPYLSKLQPLPSAPSKPSSAKATLAEFRRVRKHLSDGGLTESALKEFDAVLLSVIIAGEDQ